jgi:hypothetical protein
MCYAIDLATINTLIKKGYPDEHLHRFRMSSIKETWHILYSEHHKYCSRHKPHEVAGVCYFSITERIIFFLKPLDLNSLLDTSSNDFSVICLLLIYLFGVLVNTFHLTLKQSILIFTYAFFSLLLSATCIPYKILVNNN